MKKPIFLWLQETLNRFFIKQPQYFKYWTILSYVLMGICGIPYVLTSCNIVLPEPLASLSNKLVSGAAAAMWFMSKLVVKTPAVGKTDEGQAVQVTSKEQMPFTAKTEAKEIQQQTPPLETIQEVPPPGPAAEEEVKK